MLRCVHCIWFVDAAWSLLPVPLAPTVRRLHVDEAAAHALTPSRLEYRAAGMVVACFLSCQGAASWFELWALSSFMRALSRMRWVPTGSVSTDLWSGRRPLISLVTGIVTLRDGSWSLVSGLRYLVSVLSPPVSALRSLAAGL